jgi:glyoxylase-like metal-dependent hydrolase (beta-lactamase superfamily II)
MASIPVELLTKDDPKPPTTSSFFCTRLNETTFLIIEDDSYGEQPHIYIKLFPTFLLITDTGCSSAREPQKHRLISLRKYLEIWQIESNGNSPLNPNGAKPYAIICSHCHYDHILGIEQFLSSEKGDVRGTAVIASSHFKSFILDDLPTTSLCRDLNIATPEYSITHWADHLSYLPSPYPPPKPAEATQVLNADLDVQFLHIPGHTPDSLAWYDVSERWIYVGDTFYEFKRSDGIEVPGFPQMEAPIIFPLQGNWKEYMTSLETLFAFIKGRNSETSSAEKRVKVGCGHLTAGADAEDMVVEVQKLFQGIIGGDIAVEKVVLKRGVEFYYWGPGKGRFAVLAPRKVFEEARKGGGLDGMK